MCNGAGCVDLPQQEDEATMIRRQGTESTAQERLDAAVVDAYARRVAGTAPTAEDAALEAEIAAAELQAYVTLHQRVATLPQQEVAPSVRAVVLSAAATGAQELAAAQTHASPLVRLLTWLMRPGPLLAIVTALAVVVGVSVRQESPSAAVAKTDGAVAMLEPTTMAPAPVAVEPAPAMPAEAPASAPVGAAPAAAAPEPALAAAAAETAKPQAAAATAPALPRPMRTIEAQAASLGPVDAPAANEAPKAPRENLAKYAQPAENQKAVNADRVAPRDEVQRENFESSLDVATKKLPQANAATAKEENVNQRAGNAAAQEDYRAAPQQQYRPAAQAPDDAQKEVATKNGAARNQVTEAAAGDAVARWKQAVADAQTPDERVVALKQLVVAAQAAGDDKTAKAAQQALKVSQAQVVARKRAENLQQTPPAQRAKAAPGQGSEELKAQKPRD